MLDDIIPQDRNPARFHILKCQYCNIPVERAVNNKKATCFDCRSKRNRDSQKYKSSRFKNNQWSGMTHSGMVVIMFALADLVPTPLW